MSANRNQLTHLIKVDRHLYLALVQKLHDVYLKKKLRGIDSSGVMLRDAELRDVEKELEKQGLWTNRGYKSALQYLAKVFRAFCADRCFWDDQLKVTPTNYVQSLQADLVQSRIKIDNLTEKMRELRLITDELREQNKELSATINEWSQKYEERNIVTEEVAQKNQELNAENRDLKERVGCLNRRCFLRNTTGDKMTEKTEKMFSSTIKSLGEKVHLERIRLSKVLDYFSSQGVDTGTPALEALLEADSFMSASTPTESTMS